MLYKTAFWGALGKGDTMKREDGESMSEVVSVSEMFGKDVFNDAVMKDRLPKSVYKKLKKTIDLVIRLEMWDGTPGTYDRIGLDEEYIDILGNKVLCNTIPIRPGRNVAVICESAAITNRQKKMGTNTAKELEQRILASMQKSEE